MKQSLHPKLLSLRNKIGSTPILYSGIKSEVKQPLQMRAKVSSEPSSDRLLRQYFAIWGVPDDYGTMPMKGCFTKSINDRGPKSNASFKIPALYMHRQGDSVGLPSVLIEDEIGLYAEVPILEGVQVADELVIRHKSGTCNNGSYGFDYCWDKMEYDEATDTVIMKECELYEISFVTIGSQTETFGVRGADGVVRDERLEDDTESLIRSLPKNKQLEIRSLIDRHISLTRQQPTNSLEVREPSNDGIDYNFIINNLKIQ